MPATRPRCRTATPDSDGTPPATPVARQPLAARGAHLQKLTDALLVRRHAADLPNQAPHELGPRGDPLGAEGAREEDGRPHRGAGPRAEALRAPGPSAATQAATITTRRQGRLPAPPAEEQERRNPCPRGQRQRRPAARPDDSRGDKLQRRDAAAPRGRGGRARPSPFAAWELPEGGRSQDGNPHRRTVSGGAHPDAARGEGAVRQLGCAEGTRWAPRPDAGPLPRVLRCRGAASPGCWHGTRAGAPSPSPPGPCSGPRPTPQPSRSFRPTHQTERTGRERGRG